MRRSIPLASDEARAVESLGKRLKRARLRRNLTQNDVAERAGVSRLTCIDLEAGKPGVSIAALVRYLSVLGYPDRIAGLLEADPIGEDLEQVHGRKRATARRDVEDF
ncbi:MAG: helix-turn-helix transcriptional regulator [Alphaproteobacteria bacterium]|nr:helix-turn-helix transcriptional regulator [Alphaproteobacteria bacterium]